MALKLFTMTGRAVVAILRVIGSALYQPDDGERVSTWSIRKRDAGIFFVLLYGLWMVAAVALAYAQYAPAPLRVIQWATPPPHLGDGTAYAVIQRFGAVVVPLMVVALALMPVIINTGRMLMSLARFIEEKLIDPIWDAKIMTPALEKVRAEIAAEVTQTVTAEMVQMVNAEISAATTRNNEQWASWLARRDAALDQGLEFNEPRPDEVDVSQS